jgi:hypothetical protein
MPMEYYGTNELSSQSPHHEDIICSNVVSSNGTIYWSAGRDNVNIIA